MALTASIEIEEISDLNVTELARMMFEMWPDSTYEEEKENCERILNAENETCYLALQKDQYVAFIYLNLRSEYVEGTKTSPVAYIEGVYVRPGHRQTGIAQKLIKMGEDWGRANGCTQYASDAELTNQPSIDLHQKAGFRQANKIVCFVKEINP